MRGAGYRKRKKSKNNANLGKEHPASGFITEMLATTRSIYYGEEMRDHIFATRNLLAGEWMAQDAAKSKKAGSDIAYTVCNHGEPGEPERECSLRGRNRCLSCGFLFCERHALTRSGFITSSISASFVPH